VSCAVQPSDQELDMLDLLEARMANIKLLEPLAEMATVLDTHYVATPSINTGDYTFNRRHHEHGKRRNRLRQISVLLLSAMWSLDQ